MNKEGRAYQHRAMELIKFCRTFSTASEQSCSQIVRLESVLEACDSALAQAVGSRDKRRGPTDLEIEKAERKLLEYERDFHANNKNVKTRMKAAKDGDEKWRRKDRISATNGTRRVCFHIMRSLLDREPIIVEQALMSTSELPVQDILWNFSHYKGEDKRRLTLAQNPQFYEGIFPTAYEPAFNTRPTENCLDTIYVLTNNERRVFLELGNNKRTYDNVWRTNNILIFKEIGGNIVGEAIVGQFIPALPLFWSRMEHPEFRLEEVGEIDDWRAPIHDLWDSPRTRIHIRPSGH